MSWQECHGTCHDREKAYNVSGRTVRCGMQTRTTSFVTIVTLKFEIAKRQLNISRGSDFRPYTVYVLVATYIILLNTNKRILLNKSFSIEISKSIIVFEPRNIGRRETHLDDTRYDSRSKPQTIVRKLYCCLRESHKTYRLFNEWKLIHRI